MADPLITSRFYFSPALQAKLNVAQTKSVWGGLVKGDLGSTRTAKIIRYANAQAAADKTGGTVLRSATNTGALSLVGGDLSGLGAISGVTSNLAVDFSSGFHVLSFETPGGVEMRGAIGLSLDAQIKAGVAPGAEVVYVFTTEGNLDAAKGWLLGDITIFAPKFMPTGIGPAAPDVDAGAPVTLVFEDHTNPQNIVTREFPNVFDKRHPNWTFENQVLAGEYGDGRVDTASSTIKHGKHQFSLMRTGVRKAGGGTFWQVTGGIMAYDTTWANSPGYPGMTAFDITKDETYPNPFKMFFKNAAGQILPTAWGVNGIVMRDNLPVNDPSLNNRFDLDATTPLRPHVKIGDTLIWENEDAPDCSVRNRFFAGVHDYSLRPSIGKSRGTCNPSEPILAGAYQPNGLGHLHAMPQWPMNARDTSWSIQSQNDDPHLWNEIVHTDGNFPMQWWGWDFEPGSRSGKERRYGNGGPRFNRSVIESVAAWYVSKPNAVRAAGNVPVRKMVHAARRAYHNLGLQFLKAGPDFVPMWSVDEARTGRLVLLNNYYYPGPALESTDRTLNLAIAGASSNYQDYHRGPSGKLAWGGVGPDFLHNYPARGWYAILFKDLSNAILSRHDYNMQWATAIGGRGPETGGQGVFNRVQAWRFLHYTMAWVMGSKHPMGTPQAAVEARFKVELLALYETYKAVVLDNEQSFFAKGLRGFGQPAKRVNGVLDPDNPQNQVKAVTSDSGNIGMYMGHALIFMEASGLFDVMSAKDPKIAAALKWMVDCLDKQCVEMFAVTGGYMVSDYQFYDVGAYAAFVSLRGVEPTLADMPADWAAMAAAQPRPGVQNWIQWADGSSRGQEAGAHLIAQWIFARNDFAFARWPHPRAAEAAQMLSDQYADHAARVAAISNLLSRANMDMIYQVPSHGRLLPVAKS